MNSPYSIPGSSASTTSPRLRVFAQQTTSTWQQRGNATTLVHEEAGSVAIPESLWMTNADDRLPRAPLGRVEGRNSVVEGRDVADVRPQSSVPHALDDLAQLATIGLDDEVD